MGATTGANSGSSATFFFDDVLVTTLVDAVTVLGDCNLDGVVNFSDISSLISLLSGGGFLAEADVNEDGVVDFLDISPFISILSSQD